MPLIGPTIWTCLLAFSAFVGFSILDYLVFDQIPHAKITPVIDRHHLTRTVVSLALSVWIIRSMLANGDAAFRPSDNFKPWHQCLLPAGLLWLSVLLFVASPEFFSMLVREDGLLENLSFVSLLVSSVLFAASHLRLQRSQNAGLPIKIFTGAISVVLFVVAMEEISWMQRVLGVPTPELFRLNDQQETNLHNFATYPAEIFYYFGSFGFLAILPFMALANGDQFFKQLGEIVPSRGVGLFSLSIAAFTWELFNTIPIQMMFWMAVLLLACIVYFHAEYLVPVGVFLATLISVQVIFLDMGHHLVRSWDLTEYRETFIALGFLLYSLEIFRSVRRSYLPPIELEI